MAYNTQPPGMSWIGTFTAVFAATLLAGAILLLGVRSYIHWSIQDTVRQLNEKIGEKRR